MRRRLLLLLLALVFTAAAVAVPAIGASPGPSSPDAITDDHDHGGIETHGAEDVSPTPALPTGVSVPPATPTPVPPRSAEEEARRQSQSRSASEALAAAQEEVDGLARRISALSGDRDRGMARAEALAPAVTLLAAQVVEAEDLLRLHAVALYARGGGSEIGAFLRSERLGESAFRQALGESVVRFDFDEHDRLVREEAAATAALGQAVAELGRVRGEITASQDRLVVARQDLEGAKLRAAAMSAAAATTGAAFQDGFRFPVAGPYTFRNDWGEPRGGGTRPHQGNDLFAAMGTPLVAVERGVIANKGYDTNGGDGLFLVGQSGVQYYYAHLSSFAPGIADGVVVQAGEVIGAVGDSGNAKGGSPHCHFQIHPGGGAPVNPYPLLAAVAEGDPNNRGSS